MRKIFALMLLTSGVAACNSSTEPLTDVATFDQRLDAAIAKDEAFVSSTRPMFSRNELPTSGGATYNGLIGVGVEDGSGTVVIGDLSITTNFNPNADLITGSADNFIQSDGAVFNGALGISNGAEGNPLNYGTGFTADIDGTLTNAQTGSVVVKGQLLGGFGTPLNNSGTVVGVRGNVDVTLRTNQGTVTGSGNFIAD